MTPEQIQAAAWKEFTAGAEGAWVDWLDEEGEYGDDWEKVYAAQGEIVARLKTPEGKRELASQLLTSANQDEGHAQ